MKKIPEFVIIFKVFQCGKNDLANTKYSLKQDY